MTSPCCSFFFFLCDDLMAPAWSQHPVVSSQQRWMETHINSHFLLTVLWELGWNWCWIWMLKLGVKHFHRFGVLHWGTTKLFNGVFFISSKMSVGDLLACCLRVTQWHCGKHKKTLTQEWTWHRRSVIHISINDVWWRPRVKMWRLVWFLSRSGLWFHSQPVQGMKLAWTIFIFSHAQLFSHWLN